MGNIILIRGPIGPGKSTLALALKDTLREVSMIDGVGLKRQIDADSSSDWRCDIALDTAPHLTNLLMQRRRTVMVDIYSASRSQLNGLTALCCQNNYNLTVVRLETPLGICLSRVRNRNVPDITFEINQEMVRRYWLDTFTCKSELVFDSTVLKAQTIARQIQEQL